MLLRKATITKTAASRCQQRLLAPIVHELSGRISRNSISSRPIECVKKVQLRNLHPEKRLEIARKEALARVQADMAQQERKKKEQVNNNNNNDNNPSSAREQTSKHQSLHPEKRLQIKRKEALERVKAQAEFQQQQQQLSLGSTELDDVTSAISLKVNEAIESKITKHQNLHPEKRLEIARKEALERVKSQIADNNEPKQSLSHSRKLDEIHASISLKDPSSNSSISFESLVPETRQNLHPEKRLEIARKEALARVKAQIAKDDEQRQERKKEEDKKVEPSSSSISFESLVPEEVLSRQNLHPEKRLEIARKEALARVKAQIARDEQRQRRKKEEKKVDPSSSSISFESLVPEEFTQQNLHPEKRLEIARKEALARVKAQIATDEQEKKAEPSSSSSSFESLVPEELLSQQNLHPEKRLEIARKEALARVKAQIATDEQQQQHGKKEEEEEKKHAKEIKVNLTVCQANNHPDYRLRVAREKFANSQQNKKGGGKTP